MFRCNLVLKYVPKVCDHFVKCLDCVVILIFFVDFSSIIHCGTYVDNIQPASGGKIRKYHVENEAESFYVF